VYNDQIKLKGEHEAIERENQGEEQGERRPTSLPEPKTLRQPIQPPIQTQTNIWQHSKQIRPFCHYLKTPKSSQEWR
jgi:hypothetical protein